MSNPIVDVEVTVHFKPVVIKIQIDTREDGEWDAARVKAAAQEIAYDRARHSDEQPDIQHVEVLIKSSTHACQCPSREPDGWSGENMSHDSSPTCPNCPHTRHHGRCKY